VGLAKEPILFEQAESVYTFVNIEFTDVCVRTQFVIIKNYKNTW